MWYLHFTLHYFTIDTILMEVFLNVSFSLLKMPIVKFGSGERMVCGSLME